MIKINNIPIDRNVRPKVIAELSGNHNGDLGRAYKLLDEAKKNGADFVKLQTFDPNTITIKSKRREFLVKSKNKNWNKKTLHELYSISHTPWDWHEKIFKKAKQIGVTCFSSVFDENMIEKLEKIKTPAYKISSFETNHFPLIDKVIRTRKPIIVSVGMCNLEEIKNLVKLFNQKNHKKFILLKCTSSYPAPTDELNLLTLSDLRNKFNCEVGFSDHSLGIGAALTSVSFGASIIEKHFTLDKNDRGVDSSFSMDPTDLKILSKELKNSWKSIGRVNYGPTKSEKKSIKSKRSIYSHKFINKNKKITKEDLIIIRPANGLNPKLYSKLIGSKAKIDIKKGIPLKIDMFKI